MTALQKYTPEHFRTPLVPLSCTFCIFAAIFLIGSVGYQACYRFGIVLGVCVVRGLPPYPHPHTSSGMYVGMYTLR